MELPEMGTQAASFVWGACVPCTAALSCHSPPPACLAILWLAHRTHTLGGAGRTAKVRGGPPSHDVGGLSVGAVLPRL